VGLKRDLIVAKIRAAQVHDPEFKYEGKVKEGFEVQSEYETRAILNFLTNPNLKFTVEKLKASVELESLETTTSSDAHVKISRTMSMVVIQLGILKSLVDKLIDPLKAMANWEIDPAVPALGGTKPLAGLINPFIIPVYQFLGVIEKQIEVALPKTEGQNAIQIPAYDLQKSGGQGGSMKAVGHAYIGMEDPVPDSDTQVEAVDNDFSSVVLVEEKIPRALVDNVETGEEELMG